MSFGKFYKEIQILEEAVKILLHYFPGQDKIKIWDAGCGLGAEPLTLSLLLSEKLQRNVNDYQIIASDIDECNLTEDLLKEAIVSKSEIENLPEKIITKYFIKSDYDEYYFISDKIKKRISFVKHDLLSFLPLGKDFNMIICKNVLKHIPMKNWVKILLMFHTALCYDGILVLDNEQEMPFQNDNFFKKIKVNSNIFLRKN